MSRRKKYTYRQDKEYARYKMVHKAYKKHLKKKGLEFYDPIRYTKAEYFNIKAKAIHDFKEEHGLDPKAKVTISNYLRDLVYSQAYYRDLKEVRKARASIKENIVRVKKEILLGEEEITVKGKTKVVSLSKEDIAKKEQELEWLKKANKFRVGDIRTGKQSFLDLLSEVNDELKNRGFDDSYDRRKWIRKEFFGYAS